MTLLETKDPAPRVSAGRAGVVEGLGQHFDTDDASSHGKPGPAVAVSAVSRPANPTHVGKVRGTVVAKGPDWEVVESRPLISASR